MAAGLAHADVFSNARERLADADTIRALSAEGRLLYQKDRIRLDGAMYCERSIALAEKGEPRLGIQEASKALALGQMHGDAALAAVSSRDLAIAYSYAGDFEHARLHALQSLAGAPGRLPGIAAPAHKILGDIAMRQGRLDEAVASYRTARAAASPKFRELVDMSLVSAYVASGRTDEARALYRTLPDGANPALRQTRARITGNLLLAEGRPQQAMQAYAQALEIATGEDAAYHRVWAREGIARSLLAMKDVDGARAAYIQAAADTESVRARFRSEEFKTGLFADMQQIFERAIALLSETGDENDSARAWLLSEASRSRSLLDAVRGRVAAQSAAANSPDEVRAMLGANEALIEYHLLEDRLLIWVLRADGLAMHVVHKPRAAIEAEVRAFRDALFQRGWDEAAATALHAQLIAPLNLRAGERLLIVPHGALHYLPFQALRAHERYLIETHALAYLPSAGVAAQLRRRPATAVGGLAAFGNPGKDARLSLPGAEREVERIGALFPGARIFVREEASKARFSEQAGRGGVLHVAAHAEADAVDPLESRILLAPRNGDDGYLKAREVYALPLGAVDLVTLSACESGLGRVLGGDEVLGFSHAFLAAGASALMVSLWPVGDESTALLMTSAYGALNDGRDLMESLQAAQLRVMRAPGYAHPLFWAPFNLVGNWRMRTACRRDCDAEAVQ